MQKNISAFILVLLSVVFPLLSYAEECTIPAKKALAVASEKGYGFTAEKIAGEEGSCGFENSDNSVIVGVTGLETESITCEAGFFLGEQELSDGWTMIKSPVIKGGNFTYSEAPDYGTKKPGFKIQFDVNRNDPVTLVLKSIRLEGPDCEDWKNAF